MRKETGMFRLAVLSIIVMALVFGTTDGWAQGGTAAPFNKVTVSSEVAKRTLMKAVINADTARAIVDACVECRKRKRGNGRLPFFCFSRTGQLFDSNKLDGVFR